MSTRILRLFTDHPQSVDDAQRSTFIADGRGGYYNGISLPRS